MGAHYDVYEVDLREDARSLQSALRELSGHATVSCIHASFPLRHD
jgi:hypothetical protein